MATARLKRNFNTGSTMHEIADTVNDYTRLFEETMHSSGAHATETLRHHRYSALKRFRALGFPERGDEAWKYTNVQSILQQRFNPAPATVPVPPELTAIEALAEHRLVFVNGIYSPALSTPPQQIPGLKVTSLFNYLQQNTPDIASAHGNDISNGFQALNGAFVSGGCVIELEAGIRLDGSLELLFFTGDNTLALMSNPRNLILLGEASQCTLIERYIGLPQARYLDNPVNQIQLAQGAQLTHVRIKQPSNRGFYIGHSTAKLAAHSRYAQYGYTFGGLLSRDDSHIEFSGPGASAEMRGLALLSERQHADTHIRIDHHATDCTSRQSFRNIVDQHSRAVFTGRVVIHHGAQRSDASQACHALLLSRQAEADSRPQLEIYADNVKCAHGATTGYLDQDALFYLCSRGIPHAQAEQLLIEAFAKEQLGAVAEIPMLSVYLERLMTRNRH